MTEANGLTRVKIDLKKVSFYYGKFQALFDISLPVMERKVTAFIGPSGCGKSTLLRILNRIYALYPNQRATGEVVMDGDDLLAARQDVNRLRSKVGMVFQKPTPFPLSIHANVEFGVRLYEALSRRELNDRVVWALKKAGLWDEVKDKLGQSGVGLSGGQQQRLCISRAIAVKPEVLLLDEPTSALDPASTSQVEKLIEELKQDYTIVIVTHNLQQAARISDYTSYLYLGRLVEYDETERIFRSPRDKHTADYIAGRFG